MVKTGNSEDIHSFQVTNQRTKGITALRAQPRGQPRILHLKPYQTATIARLIAHRCPDQLKLPFMLWTREAIQELIRKRFGIQLSVWTVGRYLTRWGFTPQKPLRQTYEQDPAAVRRWLKREYPAIRALAHREKATVFWGDETGMRSDHQTGTSYGKRGHTHMPILKARIRFIEKFLANFNSVFSTNHQRAIFREFIYGLFSDYKRLSLAAVANNTHMNYQRLQYFTLEYCCSPLQHQIRTL
ncbi:MAG: winged helix-turn-helix domain-containing protein [Candidatus Omnitrophota bacterium]|jgi:transposase